MRACALIPAFEAAQHVEAVARGAAAALGDPRAVIVVDDGSRDATFARATLSGAIVLRHLRNAGKGSALRTGLAAARELGFDVAVSLDADAQHPPDQIPRLLAASPDPQALVLGVRDLARAGAPRANQRSNAISNFFLSRFTGTRLADTQCGLRRYPVAATLELGAVDPGYAFEAEVILRAIAAGMPIVEVVIEVVYPPANERVTHFHIVRDPARIVTRVIRTLAVTRFGWAAAPSAPRAQHPAAPLAVSLTEALARSGAETRL